MEKTIRIINNNSTEPIFTERKYFLCSSTVIEHFPLLEKSTAFKSGYDFDSDDRYYVIVTSDYNSIEKYYREVIEPYNEKTKAEKIDFWLRECCDSLLEDAPRGCLTRCRVHGVFKAIENIYNLTKDNNRAFAIYRMASYYGLNPIEFINKLSSHTSY